jgi:hypothetical protein
MESIQLPKDGSIVILDDKIEEALPLIKILSKNGIASTYYSGRTDRDLPENPTQKVRLFFVDIRLFEATDIKSTTQNILRILDRIIPDNNGPYIMLVWSKHEDAYSKELETEVMSSAFSKKPIKLLYLTKAQYFELKKDTSLINDLVDEVGKSLETRLESDNIMAIKKTIEESMTMYTKTIWEAKPNALEEITTALENKLKAEETFNLFTVWENCVNSASGKIVNNYSTICNTDENWGNNFKYGFFKMAHARLGKTINTADNDELIRNALKTLNYSFLDIVENELQQINEFSGIVNINRNYIEYIREKNSKKIKIHWNIITDKYDIYINDRKVKSNSKYEDLNKSYNSLNAQEDVITIKEIIEDFLAIKPNINTKLLIDFNIPESIHPGNVYFREVNDLIKRKELLKNYFNGENDNGKKFINTDGIYIVGDNELAEIKFIELEITPACDYAQGKQIKARLLPGLLVPEKYIEYIKNREYLYLNLPIIKFKQLCYQPIFDFRLLKSADFTNVMNPKFRIRKEVCADIQSRLSSHASRIGITCVE